jgi:hypothetical protein
LTGVKKKGRDAVTGETVAVTSVIAVGIGEMISPKRWFGRAKSSHNEKGARSPLRTLRRRYGHTTTWETLSQTATQTCKHGFAIPSNFGDISVRRLAFANNAVL